MLNISWRAIIFTLFLPIGCGGNNNDEPEVTIADSFPSIQTASIVDGPSVFIKYLAMEHVDITDLSAISFEIKPKPGAVSAALKVTYSRKKILESEYYSQATQTLRVPVFGFYSDFTNTVILRFSFADSSSRTEERRISVSPFSDPSGVYGNISIIQPPSLTEKPTFDYFYIKSNTNQHGPAVIDIDGNLRWIFFDTKRHVSNYFSDGSFVSGSQNSMEIYKFGFDGVITTKQIVGSVMQNGRFHHDIAKGKYGLIAALDGDVNGVTKIESHVMDMSTNGVVIKEWDLGAIFSTYMLENGDDPTNFVRDGVDWFHVNSAVYNPIDDSLVISSRENFVVSIDYNSDRIKWILGDQTKHWYVNYPSLRTLALTITSGDSPIGQHALSITNNGELLLFNNGKRSLNMPANTPAGIERTYSSSSRYFINESAMTATETWSFNDNIYSDICSSVYQDNGEDYLISYAVADSRTKAKLHIVNKEKIKLMQMEMPTITCNTSWNAMPIDLTNLVYN